MIGKVKWYNTTKGYGFIAPEAGGNDIFVHVTDVRAAGYDTLKPDQKISFELKNVNKGRVTATNLKVLA